MLNLACINRNANTLKGVSIGTGIVVRKPKAEAEAEAKPWEDSVC